MINFLRKGGSGIDTSDANATADDLLNPKTAYVNGQKIVGEIIPTYKHLDGTLITNDLFQLNTKYNKVIMATYDNNYFITTFEDEDGYTNLALLDKSGNELDYKRLTAYGSTTTTENMIKGDCSHTINEYGYINVGIITQYKTGTYFLNMFYIDTTKNILSEEYNRSELTLLYDSVYNAPSIRFANLNPNIYATYTRDGKNTVYLYQISNNFVITQRSSISCSNMYWNNDMSFNEDDTLLVTHISHIQDRGSSYILLLKDYSIVSSLLSEQNVDFIIVNNQYMIKRPSSGNRIPSLCSYTIDANNKLTYKVLNTLSDVKILAAQGGTAQWEMYNQTFQGNYFGIISKSAIYIYQLTEDNMVKEVFSTTTFNYFHLGFNNLCVLNGVELTNKTIISTDVINSLSLKDIKLLDTSDATATSNNILDKATAYVDGKKTTGTMPNNGSLNYSPSTVAQAIPAGYTSGGTVKAVDNTVDSNIIPENIKSGITILGITGTYTGESTETTE